MPLHGSLLIPSSHTKVLFERKSCFVTFLYPYIAQSAKHIMTEVDLTTLTLQNTEQSLIHTHGVCRHTFYIFILAKFTKSQA